MATERFSKAHDALTGANDHCLKRLPQLTVGAKKAVRAGRWASWPPTHQRPTCDSCPGVVSSSAKALRPLSRSSRLSCRWRSEEHTSELQSRPHLVCRLLLETTYPASHAVVLSYQRTTYTSVRI